MNQLKELTIGQVAKRVGLNPRTIRYYERRGLISPKRKDREGSAILPGYRLFSEREIERLAFIKKARTLNFSLREIEEFGTFVGNGKKPSPALAKLLESKLKEVHEKSRLFYDLHEHLTTLLKRAMEKDKKKSLSLPAVQQCCEPLCGPEICR